MDQVLDILLIFTLPGLLLAALTIFMVRRGWLPPLFETESAEQSSDPQVTGSLTEREQAVDKYFRQPPSMPTC